MEAEHRRDEWAEIQGLVIRVLQQRGTPEGEQHANRLLTLLRPHVLQLVRSVCRDADIAEDITQEVLARLWSRLDSYDATIAPFRNWMAQVVINATYNAMRGRARINRHELREADHPSVPNSEPSTSVGELSTAPEDLVEQVAARERMEQILAIARATLSPDEYLVWLEYTVNGSSHREIALLLERNESWARQTLLRARQKLAAALVLSPSVLSDEELEVAIERCQRSSEPLSAQELRLLRTYLAPGGRRAPAWHHLARFRRICLKLLNHLT